MKSFELPMFVASLLGCCLLSGLAAPTAHADFTFGEPVKIVDAIPALTSYEYIDCFTSDGLEMYISSYSRGYGDADLWVLKRASIEDDWGPPENLGPQINTSAGEYLASVSADGLTLYYSALLPGGYGGRDIWATTRATRNDPWGPPVNLGPTINSGALESHPWISADGLELYFRSYRPAGYGLEDIYVARREATDDPWGTPVNLGPTANSPCNEAFLSLSPDGLLLLLCEHHESAPRRPGGYGNADIWMSRRASLSDPWQAPVNLRPPVNGPTIDTWPRISPDGRMLYFASTRSGDWASYQAPILPVLDLNGDGKVADEDVVVLRAHWGESYPPCDIGPMPWGDGIVDEKDLMVLMKTIWGLDSVVLPIPRALEIPRDVVLSWTSPQSAETHDVYFGTSFDDVSHASRDNSLGVLVSQSQATTTYDPPGLLEFGQTYYWRIDEVGPAPKYAISRGPVLDFTTEAFAYPIKNVIASASGSAPGFGSERTVDGSGLDDNGRHSAASEDMWLSTGAQSTWIQFTFDKVHKLHELWVWNSNQLIEPILGFGVRTVKIEYSIDGTTWTTLEGVPEFARAPGEPGYKPNTTVGFGGVSAKYVKLLIEANWGGLAQTGLAEVRFFHVPVHASLPAPASGRKDVSTNVTLAWKPGREATLHHVHLSTDHQVATDGDALVGAVTDASFDPGPLDLGRTYYWRIDEVNEARTDSTYRGDVWDFATREYVMLDDFESYTDEEDEGTCIYQTWIDGYSNETGSRVGYTQSPFAERAVVHGGKQSMPLQYSNAESPLYSVAARTFSPVQDWTANGADTLTLWLRGNPKDFLERADGSIQISGGGTDIWGTSDQFRFAYKQLSGDGSVVAKIHSLTATDMWAKAGVMIRDSLHPASVYAFITPTPDGRRAFQNRTTIGSSARSAHSNSGTVTLPIWLKVERKSGNFTGYYSQDGKNWTVSQPDATISPVSDSINPVRISMTKDVYIGLAATGHNVSMPTIAEFSSVSFSGAVSGDWQVEAIGVEQPSNDAAPLYVAVEDDWGHTQSVVHPDPAAVQTIEWRQWLIPFSDFTSAGVEMNSVKRLSIGVGDPSNPTAGGTGVIYIDDIGVGHPLSSE